MKIALLSFEYPPETGFGGIGTYTWYQARGLAKLGHEVHVLAGATEPTDLRSTEHDGVTVFRYRQKAKRPKLFALMQRMKLAWTRNRLENAQSMRAGLGKLLEEHRYDVVEMPECGAEGLYINGRIDAPTVIKFHSPAKLIMGTYDVSRADQIWTSRLEQKAINRASKLMSCSRFLANEVKAKMGVSKPVEVIYNGIDLELFDAGERFDARERFGIPKDTPIVLFAARLERRKGIHVMKEVAARILAKHDVAFVFAGDDLFGYVANEMEPRLASLDLRGSYHFLGRLDLTGVRSCLHEADVFVLPSLWENCPYSALEAMAAGVPLLSSSAGGLPEVNVDGETGIVAEVEDIDAHVAGLERLLGDADLRARLGAAARARIEAKFTDTHIAQESAEYYARSAN